MKINDSILFICLPICGLLAFLILGYTGRDDSHFTYYVANQIASGVGIINYNGEPLEQSSTLLYAVILGLVVHLLGIQASEVGPYLSVAFYVMSLAFTMKFLIRKSRKLTGLLAFLNLPLLYWAFSGTESTLYLLLFLFLVYFIHNIYYQENIKQNFFGVIIISALLTLCRPEYPFVIGAAGLLFLIFGMFLRDTLKLRAFLLLAVVAGSGFGIAIRLWLGLDVFPNTVLAKQSDLSLIDEVGSGLFYVLRTGIQAPFSTMFYFASLVWVLRKSLSTGALLDMHTIQFMASISLAVLSFVLLAGGDWMEGGRFLVVSYFFAIFSLLLIYQNKLTLNLCLLICVLFVVDCLKISRYDHGGIPLLQKDPVSVEASNLVIPEIERRNVIHARDVSFVHKAILSIEEEWRFSEKFIIASIQGGMVPYYLSQYFKHEMYFVDLVGLATNHVHKCRGDTGWGYDPFADIISLQSCVGEKFDFIYGLDDQSWSTLNSLIDLGCEPLVKDSNQLGPYTFWKRTKLTQQFLVKCG